LKVRLTREEIETIKKLSREIFGDCEIYLFGSRIREKEGGDVDIFIIPENRENLFEKKIKLSAKLELALQKPVDVVVSRNPEREIEKEALKGVKL
jgi:predicted nucleotidyltransferase